MLCFLFFLDAKELIRFHSSGDFPFSPWHHHRRVMTMIPSDSDCNGLAVKSERVSGCRVASCCSSSTTANTTRRCTYVREDVNYADMMMMMMKSMTLSQTAFVAFTLR